jgi:hypothetical protein
VPNRAAAGGIVGSGTAASCSEGALNAALSGGGTLTFDCGDAATIAITSVKTIDADTVIQGGNRVTISGSNAVQVFRVEVGVHLELDGVTIADGFGDLEPGGGIRNLGTLVIRNSTLANNFTLGFGGAVANEGTCSMSDTTLADNIGGNGGGAIANFRTLEIRRSLLFRNTAGLDSILGQEIPGSGGGIENFGTLTISNSTLSTNTAVTYVDVDLGDIPGFGGGLFNPGTATVANCTFSRNRTTNNHPEGGGIVNEGTLAIRNTIIANSTGSDCSSDCFGNLGATTPESSHNLLDDQYSSCGDGLTMVRPEQLRLAGLDDNGGPTLTVALWPGSVAIGAGDIATCADSATVDGIDQRAMPRFGAHDLSCDIGAFEVPFSAGPMPTPTPEATFLALRGAQGDFLTAGQSFLVTPADGTFSATHEFGAVQLSTVGDRPSDNWNLFFSSPEGSDLTVGDYDGAAAPTSPQQPGLNVNGDGRGCDFTPGRFSIREASFSIDGTIEHFAADFEQYCENEDVPMFGSLRINSSLPAASPGPLPTPTPLAGVCGGDCNGDGQTTVAELITGIGIALGTTDLRGCPVFDCHGTGTVSVDCLTRAVSAALNGCP